MPEKDESVSKARLDGEDILEELDQTEQVDTDEPRADKAILDKDGIIDELESLDEAAPEGKAKEPAADERQAQEEKLSTESKGAALIGLVRRFSWMKIAIIFSCASVLCVASWFLITYLLLYTPAEKEMVDTAPAEEPAPQDEYAEHGVMDTFSEVEMQTFLVPVRDEEDTVFYLRTQILLYVKNTDPKLFQKKEREIRSVIYTVLCGKTKEDIIDAKRRGMVQVEIKHVINTVFKRESVVEVILQSIELV